MWGAVTAEAHSLNIRGPQLVGPRECYVNACDGEAPVVLKREPMLVVRSLLLNRPSNVDTPNSNLDGLLRRGLCRSFGRRCGCHDVAGNHGTD